MEISNTPRPFLGTKTLAEKKEERLRALWFSLEQSNRLIRASEQIQRIKKAPGRAANIVRRVIRAA